MKQRISRKWKPSAIISLPIVAFTVVFVIMPFIYLIMMSFTSKSDMGVFSFVNYKRLLDPVYRRVYVDSIFMGVISTFFVVMLGYPFGYFMAKLTRKWKKWINYIIIIPFCVSSLLRLYGWDIIFRIDGIINKVLLFIGIINTPLKMKYTYPATVVGMIYALLPFMIFAVYSSAEKLDWTLVEASRDLGATPLQTFRTVSFPLTLPGLMSGIILTFIPSMGLIFIAEILGGNKIILVGNLIVQEATQGKNKPFAAALAMILMLLTSLFIWIYRKVFNADELEGLV